MELPGPDREVLKKLAEDMPGMIKDLEDKRALRGERSAKMAKPSKVCDTCGRGFDFKMVTGLPEAGRCERCVKDLKDGWTAFVSDNRFAIVKINPAKTPEAEHFVGQRVVVPPEVLDMIQQRHLVKKFDSDGPDQKA